MYLIVKWDSNALVRVFTEGINVNKLIIVYFTFYVSDYTHLSLNKANRRETSVYTRRTKTTCLKEYSNNSFFIINKY